MTQVNKAGCILINPNTNQVGLIYRSKHQDYSFPKGHQEEGETSMECAMRETVEETSRLPEILSSLPSQQYIDSKGDETTVYWYLARDLGKSHTKVEEELKHELIWVDFNDVENKLSYDNLKELWNQVKDKTKEYIAELKS